MAIPEDTERLLTHLQTSSELGAIQANMLNQSLEQHFDTNFTVFAHMIGTTMRLENTNKIPPQLLKFFELTMSCYGPDYFNIPVFPRKKDKFDGEKVII